MDNKKWVSFAKKRKQSKILAMLALSCMLAGAAACNEPFAGDGNYYVSAVDGEYVLTLEDGRFALTIGNETKIGTYKYKGNDVELKFADKTVATAKVVNGEVTLSHNNATLNFIKQVRYNVSYSVDGVVANTVKVMNGKMADKPADPVKEGYSFVGWYADQACLTPYDFNAPITGNTTVYGKFVEKQVGQDEYKATFVVDGNEVSTKATNNGVVYDLPTPTKEGSTFAGWWMSDAQDVNKLTCQYTGQALKQNVKLYAVWASNAPLVSVTETGISWNALGVNTSYNVVVAYGGQQIRTQNTTATEYAFDFASREAGEYTVTVTANGVSTTAYFTNKVLARVSNFVVNEGSVLVFNPVANAEKYIITVDCGNDAHTHENYDNGKSTNFNFANCDMQEDGITFVVTAVANGYASSVSETFTYTRGLTALKGLTYDAENAMLTWSTVPNAASYLVEVTTASGTDKYTVYDKSFSVKNYTGAVSIKVSAVAFGYNSTSATVEFTSDKLPVPMDVTVDNTRLKWGAVAGATKYNVMVNGTVYEATGTWMTIPDSLQVQGASFEVSVQAVDADGKVSYYSDAVTVNYGELENVVYRDGKLCWDPVAGASSYEITLNGVFHKEVVGGANATEIAFNRAGENKIVIKAKGTGVVLGQKEVSVVSREMIFDSRTSAGRVTQYKAVGDALEFPTFTLAGYEFAGWYNVPGGAVANGAEFTGKTYDASLSILYANWAPKTYNITLKVDGEVVDTKPVKYGSTYTLPSYTLSPTGLAFKGWADETGVMYTDADGNCLNVWDVLENKVLTAAWIQTFSAKKITTNLGEGYEITKSDEIKGLKEVTIPATYTDPVTNETLPVVSVAAYAFYSCMDLETINLPDTVELIYVGAGGPTAVGSAFYGCLNLKNINIYETGTLTHDACFSSVDGVLIRNSASGDALEYGTELYYFPQGKIGAYTVPYGVSHIPQQTFENSKITDITLPSTLSHIGMNAFKNSKLRMVTFVEAEAGQTTADVLVLGNGAFRQCSGLKSIQFPARLQETAFYDNDIFRENNYLTHVDIIGKGGFYTSKDGLVCNADGREIVYCPLGREGEVRIPATVERIGDDAFWKCFYITRVVIGPNVSYIGKNAFYEGRMLSHVEFLGTESSAPLEIAENAFYDCDKIRSIVLPANLTKLHAGAFAATSLLETVTLNGGANIDYANGAFADESGVGYVKNIVIGEKMGAFAIKGVFSGCTLENISMLGTNANYSTDSYGILYNADKTELLYIPSATDLTGYEIPDTVTTIGASVFEGSKAISAIEIGANVTKIGEGAFRNSSVTQVTFAQRTADLEIGVSAFENCGRVELTLPETVTKIGSKAFAGCSGFTTVAIPASVTDLALDAFSGCSALASFTVATGNAKYAAESGILYEKDANGAVASIAITPKALSGAVLLPNTLKSIPANAFDGNTGITSIGFVDGVCDSALEIGEYAFANMSRLSSITFPEGLTRIPAYALYKSKVATVVVPNTVSRIGVAAFNNCTSLATLTFTSGNESNILTLDAPEEGYTNSTSKTLGIFYKAPLTTSGLNLPERLTELPSYSLANTEFTKLQLPSTISVINNHAVYNNTKITSIEFKKNTAGGRADLTLGAYAFASCTSMASFTVPNSIKSYVGEVNTTLNGTGSVPINGAFYKWTKLATLTFEDGITTLGSGMFARTPTTLLHSLTIPNSVKTIGDYAFADQGFKNGLTLGSGVESIGVGAFIHIQATTLNIPASVKEIKAYAFATFSSGQKTKFTQINFASGSKLSSIGDYAFKDSPLTSITLPTNTEVPEIKLGVSVFMNSTALASATIPSNVKDLNGAFLGCTALKTLNYTTEGVTYDATLKMMLADEGKKLVRYDGTATEVVIPDTVEVVANGAFMGAASVTKVTLGANVKVIEDYAFASTNVATIDFGTNSLVREIGNYAFYKTKLTSVVVPATVVSMGDHVFDGCTSLTSAEVKGTSLGNYTFNGCSVLASVTLNDNITHLGDNVFYNCKLLTQIDLPTSLRTMGKYALAYTGLTSVTLPEYLTNDNVDGTITGYWFYYCQSLTSVTFECTNLNVLPYAAFQSCKLLNNVAIPEGVTVISSGAFDYCSELETITFPTTLQKLYGLTIFSGCAKIKTLDFSHTQLAELESQYGGASNSTFQSLSGLETLKFPVSLTSLDPNIVYKSNNLVTFSAPGLRVMNVYLSGRTRLTTVELSPELSVIGEEVFYNTPALKNFEFPDTLISIGAYAFCNSGIEGEVFLSNGLTTLGDYAFYGTDITSVYLPETFELLGLEVFGDCAKLASIQVNEGNMHFRSGAYGELYNNANELIFFPVSASGDENGNVTLAAGTVIPESAFEGCVNIKSVTLPSDMKSIPAGLFAGSSIESIVIPEGVLTIAEGAFEGCENLTSVTLPSTLTEIGENAFKGCTALTTIAIPDSVTTIGNNAFAQTGLTSVVVPATVVHMGSGVFSGCTALTSAEFKGTVTGAAPFSGCTALTSVTFNDETTSLGDGFFQGCTALSQVTLPASLTSLGSYAFSGTSLTSIVVPASIAKMGDYVFSGCTLLTTAEFKGTAVGNYTFNGCTALTSVTFNDETTSVGEGFFKDCASITAVTLPTSVTSLGSYAFSGTSLTSIVVPASIAKMGDYVFSGCTLLTTAEFKGTAVGNYTFNGCTALTSVTFNDETTSVGNGFFQGCTSITTVALPTSLKELGAYAFSGTKLTSCTIPASVTTIGEGLFKDCSELASVTLHDDITSIGSYAFQNCAKITQVTLPANLTSMGLYTFAGTGITSVALPSKLTNTDALGKTSGYWFADCKGLTTVTFGGTAMTAIPLGAFNGCNLLTTLNIPEGVTTIANAFGGCSGLTTLTFPSTLTTLYGEDMFLDCVNVKALDFSGTQLKNFKKADGSSTNSYPFRNLSWLETLKFPVTMTSITKNQISGSTANLKTFAALGVKSFSLDIFKNQTKLTTVEIASNATSIGANVFQGCTSLKYFTFPSATLSTIGNYAFYQTALEGDLVFTKLTSIGQQAFEGTKIKSVTLPATFRTLGTYAFYNSAVETVTFASNAAITTISDAAFLGCTNLKSVTLSSKITAINNYAFWGCTSLTELVIPASVTKIGAQVFEEWTAAQTIKVTHLTEAEATAKYGAGVFGNATVVYKQ